MMTPDTEGRDLGDEYADAAEPDGRMNVRASDAGETDQDSMSEALGENIEELGRGENPLTVQAHDDGRGEEGNAEAFSPGRADRSEDD
ncbi:MAG TPA: hypothetical protein VK045_13405 [Ornithinicoccus sp.]|nr:hypothetical protein [Ornithinicoccus sp.]